MRSLLTLIALSPLLAVLGCGGEDAGTPTPTPTALPAATFTQVWDEVLVKACAFGSACHGIGEGGMKLTESTAYDALVGVESAGKGGAIRVIPRDVDGSYLIQKLRGDAGIVGDPMPPPNGLDAERLAIVERWIAAGALND